MMHIPFDICLLQIHPEILSSKLVKYLWDTFHELPTLLVPYDWSYWFRKAVEQLVFVVRNK